MVNNLDVRILSSQSHIARARGHSMKIVLWITIHQMKRYSFTEHTVNIWNLLPEEGEKAGSTSKASNKNRRNLCAVSITHTWALRRQGRDTACLSDAGKEEEEWCQSVKAHMLLQSMSRLLQNNTFPYR